MTTSNPREIPFSGVPGSIRELQNFIERSVIKTSYGVLNPPLEELEILPNEESPLPVRTLADAERGHIATALRETNWAEFAHSGDQSGARQSEPV